MLDKEKTEKNGGVIAFFKWPTRKVEDVCEQAACRMPTWLALGELG